MNDHVNPNAPIRQPIQVLCAQVANQIAAGEVVERPASVLKEIMENSIDAKASRIEVELLNGGLSLIRSTDDGMGIAEKELALSVCRHATSKIQTTQDLEHIKSLGFRGEALASIASVSKLKLISKIQGKDAHQCRVNPNGEAPEILPAAHKEGTTVEIQDLFYNVPVRRKFLKSVKTEFERIDELFKKIALSHYDIHFTLTHNQKKLRDYPKALSAAAQLMRIQKIVGKAFVQSAYQIDFEQNGLKLSGYVGSPEVAGRHADGQYFFVNQRIIRDKVVSHAIKTAFQTAGFTLEGVYPAYVLYLELDPKEVDINVHPTKYEVRFCQARLIHDFIHQSLLAVLTHHEPYEIPAPSFRLAPLSFKAPLHVQTLPAVQGTLDNRWSTFSHYYLLSLQTSLVVIDKLKAKSASLNHPGACDTVPLLFPLGLTESQLPQAERFILQSIGFDFSQNIKQEWILKAIPKGHECLVILAPGDIENLFK